MSQSNPEITAASAVPDYQALERPLQFTSAAAAKVSELIAEEGNPGLKDRNKANVQLFMNAAAVVGQGLDRAKIYYPAAL